MRMKTNLVMKRQMGEFEVAQRTKDGKFNATTLLKQWNEHSGQQKQMVHFLENSSTNEFIETIESEEDIKERNSVLIKSRGKNGGTWMHPFLFIDFAMWLNPTFKYSVIKFVYDKLIELRVEGGDNYKDYSSAISQWHLEKFGTAPTRKVFINFGKIIQKLVFENDCKESPWETATQKELELRVKYQNVLIHCLKNNLDKKEIIKRVKMFKEMESVLIA